MATRENVLEKIWALLTVNIGTKVISILIAIVLWTVVLGSRNVEVTKEIPLEVITSSDTVPANDIPERIAFRLSGPKAFLRAVLDRREDPIRVNLAGAKPGLVTYRFFSDNIRVPIGVKVLSINPTAILIKLETIKRRDIPVRLDLRGTPPEGYKIAKAELKPDTVRIKGAETKVEGITEISTAPVNVSDLRQNVNREVSLEIARHNVQVDGTLPRLMIQMEAISANYRIRDVDVRVLTSLKARLHEKNVTVLVRATEYDMKKLDRSQVFAVVDLRGKPRGKYKEHVKITAPENIGIVKVIPNSINITLY